LLISSHEVEKNKLGLKYTMQYVDKNVTSASKVKTCSCQNIQIIQYHKHHPEQTILDETIFILSPNQEQGGGRVLISRCLHNQKI